MTLKEHLNKQPREDYNSLIAGLSKATNRSLSAVEGYISGKCAVPELIRAKISRHLKAELDFETPRTEYVAKMAKKNRSKTIARKSSKLQQAAHL